MVVNIVIFSTLFLGCFALPKPDLHKPQLFDHAASARIVGGFPAPIGSHPHMVALTAGYFIPIIFCGASLISTRTVLTAAHCIVAVYDSENGILARSLGARVGSNYWIIGGNTIQFSHNITHPNHNPWLVKNDLGLLITTSEVVLSTVINPVPLSFEHVPGDVAGIVAGWGMIYKGGPISYVLRELELSTIDSQECSSLIEQVAANYSISTPPLYPEVEICTLLPDRHGVCSGDSGSALVQVATGKQIGIVSWNYGCTHSAPDVFVRISGFQSWLDEHIV